MSATLKRRLSALELVKQGENGPALVLILQGESMESCGGLLVSHDGVALKIDRHEGESLAELTERAKAQGAGLTLVQYLPTAQN